MPRRPTKANTLTEDQELKLIELLKLIGTIEAKSYGALAEVIRATPTAVSAFMRSNKAKEAQAQYQGGREEIKAAWLAGREDYDELDTLTDHEMSEQELKSQMEGSLHNMSIYSIGGKFIKDL